LVYVDDQAVGYTPLDHPVTAGPHRVRALVPGDAGTGQEREVNVGRDDEQTLEFLF
jgi:hypothetical protein